VLLDVPATDFRGGEKVSAIVTGTGDTGVVLAHQADSTLCQWKAGQKELTDAGYRVMAISMLKYDDADVAAAAGELRRRGVKHVILMGASRGGTAAIAGAALVTPPVDGVVSLSGPGTSDTGVVADSLVPHLASPILFAVGDGDAPFNDEVKGMYATAKPGTATLVVGKDTSLHGVSLYDNDETVHQAVLAFLTQHSS
jgi:dienelactone hydrolase